jgi:hypothetical protein
VDGPTGIVQAMGGASRCDRAQLFAIHPGLPDRDHRRPATRSDDPLNASFAARTWLSLHPVDDLSATGRGRPRSFGRTRHSPLVTEWLRSPLRALWRIWAGSRVASCRAPRRVVRMTGSPQRTPLPTRVSSKRVTRSFDLTKASVDRDLVVEGSPGDAQVSTSWRVAASIVLGGRSVDGELRFVEDNGTGVDPSTTSYGTGLPGDGRPTRRTWREDPGSVGAGKRHHDLWHPPRGCDLDDSLDPPGWDLRRGDDDRTADRSPRPKSASGRPHRRPMDDRSPPPDRLHFESREWRVRVESLTRRTDRVQCRTHNPQRRTTRRRGTR